jgi:predicted nucleic acid-binding protein
LILVDTNILLRYVNPTDPAHATAKAALASHQAAGEILSMVPQNIYEFWAVATRPVAANGLGLTVLEAQAEVVRLKHLFSFLADQVHLFSEWEALVVAHDCKGKAAHDARLVAAMRTHGITRFLTFNGPDFHRYPGLTILDPAAVSVPSTTPPTAAP